MAIEMVWPVRIAWTIGMLLVGNAALAGAPVVQVWYRSSEGCPDGAQFVARLDALGRKARIVNAGDHVDFVVTLGPAPAADDRPRNLGRLERQTERGTVAIRELRAANCADVAEGLALSLELAMVPASDADQPGPPSEPPFRATHSAGATMVTDAAPVAERNGARHGVKLGLQGTIATGIAPDPLPGGSLFVGLGGGGRPEARLAARASYGASSTAGTELRMTLLTGRIEGCPVTWGPGSISVAPCASLDLGILQAESPGASGRSDSGVWFSGEAAVRASFRAAKQLSLEAELGALVPFVRYDFGPYGGTSSFFRTKGIGLAAGMGVGWTLP